MIEPGPTDVWNQAEALERYIGRWSRLVARELVDWLGLGTRRSWVDVGCGTGALTEVILERADPSEVHGFDLAPAYIEHARRHIRDPRARLQVADAAALPVDEESCDAIVSGLLLNFVPEPAAVVAEMRRIARPGAVIASYVWDYAGEMQLIRYFWDAAVELDPSARALDEGRRFPLCTPDALLELFREGGLDRLETRAIDVPTVFRDFDDYWSPFLGGQGPAPGYVGSLSDEARAALRDRLRTRLSPQADGSIRLVARAWAVRGSQPASATPSESVF